MANENQIIVGAGQETAHRVPKTKAIEEAKALLEKNGYDVVQLTEHEKLCKKVMDAYDSFDPERKKALADYVYMLSFCSKNRYEFEKFKKKIGSW